MLKQIYLGVLAIGLTGWGFLRVEAGSRADGDAQIVAEVVSGGGTAVATNGVVTLRGSLGQNGLSTHSATNSTVRLHSGFWKPDTACELYPTFITSVTEASNVVVIAFNAMKSNTYTVVYVDQSQGGLLAGSGAWTNQVTAPFVATNSGGTAFVMDDLAGILDLNRFYRVRCK